MAEIETQQKWYALSVEDTAKKMQVDPKVGLSTQEAEARLKQFGPNQLAGKAKEPGWRAFLRQYKDFMQILLLCAAVVNQVFTGATNTTIMLVILTIFNAVLGLRGESKAEASLAALEKSMKTITRVRRNGEALEIEAAALVPGDIVLMEAGNVVPADGRLFLAATMEIEEAALTGESVATLKDVSAINKPDLALGDRINMAFMNTSVTRGRGEMIVTQTGMGTEIGHIADLLNKTESEKTPLQKQLDRLTVVIAGLAGVAFVIMIILGLRNGQPFDTIFIAGVALAVSAIPTGLPAVVTTMYSMGTQVLAKQNAIVKRLPSVETLGSVSAICSDKTGTLTLNKMTAREFVIPGKNHYKVTGEGYSTQGQLLHDGGETINLEEIMLPMALCADARLNGEELIGDPTEGALIVLAAKGGIDLEGARVQYPRIAEVPFDSEYKFMATFHNMKDIQGKPVVRCFIKGAPDVLIARSSTYWEPGGKILPITEENKPLALKANEKMAESGERVMVVARKDFDPAKFDPKAKLIDVIKDLTMLAMIGIVDPPRSEARDAIAKCHSAGIQVRMITGDHAVTAAAIGRELGIVGKAMTGAEFASMSDDALKADLDNIGVIARVAPEDKIRLVSLLQQKENIVAMTGDGVNDAPALKKADIGVAMGITGTEVSKGAAVMILTDDNFATIVKAVEYGRHIYNNLFNYVRYQMAQLAAFIISYLLAAYFVVLAGQPFSPKTVIFLNFLITVPVAIALSYDKPAPDLMEHRPRPLNQPILNTPQWIRIALIGLLTSIAVVYLEGIYQGIDKTIAQTMGFVTFGLMSVAMGLNARSETKTTLNRDIFQDKNQLFLYGLAIAITYLSTELGFLQKGLGLTSLNSDQWWICIACALGLIIIDEVIKIFLRRRQNR